MSKKVVVMPDQDETDSRETIRRLQERKAALSGGGSTRKPRPQSKPKALRALTKKSLDTLPSEEARWRRKATEERLALSQLEMSLLRLTREQF